MPWSLFSDWCACVVKCRCPGADWTRFESVSGGGVDHGVLRGCRRPWRRLLLTCWMLFTLSTLPQLAVSAKLLCLLMVVICGAVPSMVRSVKLYGERSHKYVKISKSGAVYAEDFNETDALFNLSIHSKGFKSRLNIYSEKADRYLCFSRKWKLVGYRTKKGDMCEFQETVESRGYSRYRSLANESHFLAFNYRGKPLRYNANLTMGYEEHCINFVKRDNDKFNITVHNSRIAGGSPPEVAQRVVKRQRGLHKHRHKEKRRLSPHRLSPHRLGPARYS